MNKIIEISRIICMDEKDIECNHCGGLTAYRFCGGINKTHCVHCGILLKIDECKSHRVDKKAIVPRRC